MAVAIVWWWRWNLTFLNRCRWWQFESDREGQLNSYGLAVFHSRFPVRHGSNSAQRFGITLVVKTLNHFCIGYGTGWVDYKADHSLAFLTILAGGGRVLDVLTHPGEQFSHAAFEFRL